MSYTRFSLARQVDGDNSRVEMKLAMEEEENPDPSVKTTVTKPKRRTGTLCCAVIALLIFFIVGKNGHSKLQCSLEQAEGSPLL